ncbi:Protein of unknown function (DUF4005) [Salvia divinorum]|uniref:Uncharacterized protein n=1 Tax=Salvia divinorum TaxID=28513 RepID=A0ABD1H407_SALDI
MKRSDVKTTNQVSPRFGHDATESNALASRHSLTSSIGGKLISSPRVHRLAQSNGKTRTKIDRSMSSSRETAGMANHVDWKQ